MPYRNLREYFKVNPDPKLISHRFDRLPALRFPKGRNLV